MILSRPCVRCQAVLIARGDYCATCRRAREQARGNSGARGYDRQWRNVRARILARDPLCRLCGRRPSTQVDHIVYRADGGGRDEANLRGVCQPCNSARNRPATRRQTAATGTKTAPRQATML